MSRVYKYKVNDHMTVVTAMTGTIRLFSPFFSLYFCNFNGVEFLFLGDRRPPRSSSVWLCPAGMLVFSNAVFASVLILIIIVFYFILFCISPGFL